MNKKLLALTAALTLIPCAIHAQTTADNFNAKDSAEQITLLESYQTFPYKFLNDQDVPFEEKLNRVNHIAAQLQDIENGAQLPLPQDGAAKLQDAQANIAQIKEIMLEVESTAKRYAGEVIVFCKKTKSPANGVIAKKLNNEALNLTADYKYYLDGFYYSNFEDRYVGYDLKDVLLTQYTAELLLREADNLK
ncbi:hypothetical protein AAIR98_001207 [Elusimicrobium simillimum]|uniref:hypothetical protein n=1 Tax=Elusimicrobium simillimum TaxID=3143438 RepID=UPI003C6F57BF